jgi:peptide/nickel transport system permease protein
MASISTPHDDTQVISLQKRESELHADSLLQIMVRRFFKHRMAVAGLVLLMLIFVYVTLGPIILRTLGVGISYDGISNYSEAYGNKTNIMNKFDPPSADHPFGTDGVGRDVLARTIYGGQVSLLIGITSVFISITLGTSIGLIAGYFGGWVDALLMRFVEALLAIPTLIMLLVLSRVLRDSVATTSVNFLGRELSFSVVVIILIIGFTSWMGLSRIVRSVVLSLKEQEFVLAARTVGARSGRIILVHILPNCVAPVVVAATLGVGVAIIVETALSFLGFGVVEPTATWGNIITRARERVDDLWFLWVFPGALITLTVLAINFIGDGLRDALDPRSLK